MPQNGTDAVLHELKAPALALLCAAFDSVYPQVLLNRLHKLVGLSVQIVI